MLSGEVHGNSSMTMNAAVALQDMSTSRTYESAGLRSDGYFTFTNVPYGDYHLAVLDGGGHEVHGEMVTVRAQGGMVLVQLADNKIDRPPDGGVSMQQLLHPPAKKAMQAFAAAHKYSAAGDHAKAAEELEKAVRISPDFADAWTNLGAQYLRLAQFEPGLEAVQQACKLTTPTALMLSNLAFAEDALHRPEEALAAARQAVRLDPTYGRGQYLLGYLLTKDPRTLSQAIRHLELAGPSVPGAQELLDRARRETSVAMASR